jgi:hypothetical protein
MRPEPAECDVACQGCHAVGALSVHTQSALLSIRVDRKGLPEFDLDQIGMDIEMECCRCSRFGQWCDVAYVWWEDQTPAERRREIDRARHTSTHFGEAKVSRKTPSSS